MTVLKDSPFGNRKSGTMRSFTMAGFPAMKMDFSRYKGMGSNSPSVIEPDCLLAAKDKYGKSIGMDAR
jgi:hypothetical protein